jgi:hypothetical protein
MRLKQLASFLVILALSWTSAIAQNDKQAAPVAPVATPDYSGMYAFLRDGEFVQLNVEDGNRLTGFISRYGDSESDRGAFLDQFFKQAKLDGSTISFTTATVHGVYFDFKGQIAKGEGKNPGDEGFYLLRGTVTEYSADADGKVVAKSHAVSLKSFPKNLSE